MHGNSSHSQYETVSAVSRITWIGLWANLVLATIKVVAGSIGHSRAVVADGLHSLSDLVTDIAVLVGVRFWSAPADENHPHGHQRMETIVAVFIGVLLAAAAVGIAWDAIATIDKGQEQKRGLIALGAALLSIVVKEVMYRWTLREGRRLRSLALEANAWHHRTDALSSIPAALAVGLAWFIPSWGLADLVGALIVSVFILYAAWGICRPALETLMDRGADAETTRRLEEVVCSVQGVKDVHSLRTRYLGSSLQIDMHIRVDGLISVDAGHNIALGVEDALYALGPHIIDVLVHVDPWMPDEHSDATECEPEAEDLTP
ncbi:cation diffusion facilitator family transporter [Oleidesulfovibrio sp.]|uniref:cation diffusion facilitator family transporter n=1 Tax=Oleidesulfovibrio sp. TaxID=2909707 RepID=UPI003A83C958